MKSAGIDATKLFVEVRDRLLPHTQITNSVIQLKGSFVGERPKYA